MKHEKQEEVPLTAAIEQKSYPFVHQDGRTDAESRLDREVIGESRDGSEPSTKALAGRGIRQKQATLRVPIAQYALHVFDAWSSISTMHLHEGAAQSEFQSAAQRVACDVGDQLRDDDRQFVRAARRHAHLLSKSSRLGRAAEALHGFTMEHKAQMRQGRYVDVCPTRPGVTGHALGLSDSLSLRRATRE